MPRLLCRLLTVVPGEPFLIAPPTWTAHIGQRWEVADIAPWNLYNGWWRFGWWVTIHAD